MVCPCCTGSLTKVQRDDIQLSVCTTCGGVWMGDTTLRRFARALREKPTAVAAAKALAEQAFFDFEPDPAELLCPRCERPMEVTRHPSGVSLDLCRIHGVWFDRDELTQVAEAPEGASLVDAALGRLRAPAPVHASSASSDLAVEALIGTVEVADAVSSSGVPPEQLVDAAGASLDLAGGALDMLGGLASGAIGVVFDALGSIDLS